ncbi:Tocopherol cyclase [Citrus sinensis]|nr:Tocopherol cyclase [Citrus sinensis]
MESNLYFSQNLGFRTVEHPDSTLRPLLYTKRRHFNRVLVLASSAQTVGGVSVNPVYKPTPRNRELRTPHSGYHFDGSTRRFFEGWYFRVSIPERKQSFCIIYSVENPAFKKKLSSLEVAQHGPRFTGVGVQILGADDKYMCHYSEESSNFWGSRHELMLGNTFRADKGSQPPTKEEFKRRVSEGFQVTPLWHQGCIHDDGRTNFAETVKSARWEYSTRPVYGWGNVGSKQNSTAGWLAAFPVFEPHWQICMAGGLSTGIIVQCNVFEGATGEVALTAGGGLRQLPVLDSFENAAMIGIHYDGILYEFVPWNGVVSWEISQWGYWYFAAENQTHMVELKATTKYPGTTLRAPTSEAGLAPACKDTCFGELTLQLWERRYDGTKGKMILDVTSDMAALEVGGGPWFNTWKAKTATPELLRRTLNVPVDVDGLFGFVPFFKPPGL